MAAIAPGGGLGYGVCVTMPTVFWRVLMPLCGSLCLCGCFFRPDSGADEDHNPLIAEARAKKTAYNFDGAVTTLEKALEANPRLALAHWELGLIYYENLNDYAAAIYHFEKLLKLRPQWRQARTARQFIDVCKIELAKSAPPIPQTPQIQRLIDNLTAKQLELTRENTQLNERLQALQVQVQQLAAENAHLKQEAAKPANLPGQPPAPRPPTPSGQRGAAPLPGSNLLAALPLASPPKAGPAQATPALLARTNLIAPATKTPAAPVSSPPASPVVSQAPTSALPPPVAALKPRTVAVKPGETIFGIARRLGIKQSDLLAANPGVDPKKLRAGQLLHLPGP